MKFSTEDREKIKEAVAGLERESSGELVFYYAKKSDGYSEAAWKLPAIIGFVAVLIAAILAYLWQLPPMFTPFVLTMGIALLMLTVYIMAVLVPVIRVGFTPEAIVQHRVLTKARDMFLQEEVFATQERIGILIFMSELERKVVVLGDSGINKKIEDHDWNRVVELIVQGIKDKQPAQGIIQAVEACKQILLENNFVIKPGDTNELSDAIRIEE